MGSDKIFSVSSSRRSVHENMNIEVGMPFRSKRRTWTLSNISRAQVRNIASLGYLCIPSLCPPGDNYIKRRRGVFPSLHEYK